MGPALPVLMVVASVMFGSPAAARPCRPLGDSASRSSPAGDPHRLHYLTDVRAGAHRCFDRVTFELRPATTSKGTFGYRLEYQSPPIRQDGSGKPVDVKGQAFLVVRLAPVRDVDLSGDRPEPTYRGPDSVRPRGGTRIVEARHISSFEGTVKWAIGLDARRPFRVMTLDSPTRLVVDV